MNKNQIMKLTRIALLIAAEIILSRFLAISTPILKISLAFLPIAVIGMMYGPAYGFIAGALGDFIGAILFPIGGYFPGFTLTAGLAGATYGLLLYKAPKNLVRITLAAAIITIGWHLCLDTLWLQMITGKGYLALLPARVMKTVLMLPVQVVTIKFAYEVLLKRLNLAQA